MKKQSTLLLAAGLLLSIAACKKEETKVTVKEKLTAHQWKSTGFIKNGAVESSWCWLNSLYDFTNAGTLYFTQGDNLGACSGSAIGDIFTISYKVSADEKQIIFLRTTPGETDTFEIVSLTDTQLKTKRVINKDTPSPDTWEDTFTAQ
jgi:hypothetical protein